MNDKRTSEYKYLVDHCQASQRYLILLPFPFTATNTHSSFTLCFHVCRPCVSLSNSMVSLLDPNWVKTLFLTRTLQVQGTMAVDQWVQWVACWLSPYRQDRAYRSIVTANTFGSWSRTWYDTIDDISCVDIDVYTCSIGPGLLTRSILDTGVKRIAAIEKDERFLPTLTVSQ